MEATFFDNIPDADIAALIVFLISWGLYTYTADNSRLYKNTISYIMDAQRGKWLKQASMRELKIIDTSILGILITGISFYASTTIFVIGGLFAALSYTETLRTAFEGLPFAEAMTSEQLALRIGLLLAIFIYAFFKFAWAYRLANYTGILIGGLHAYPSKDTLDEEDDKRAEVAAGMSRFSGRHFNRGLRAYFFALATLGWFVSPLAFIFSMVIVIFILARREFSSRSVKVVQEL